MKTILEIKQVSKPTVGAFVFDKDSHLGKEFFETKDRDLDQIEDAYYRWFWDRVNMGYSGIMAALNKLEEELIENKVLVLCCPYRSNTVRDYLSYNLRKKGYTIK